MIRSMTGFGRAQGVLGGKDITVEIRSVNHRYFEFSARLPRAYSWLEEKLKGVAQGAASRGKVEVSLLIQTVEGSDAQVVVNTALAREYVEALRELGRELDLPDDLSLSAVEEQRILAEAAIVADRWAVDEETVRLRSHIAQLRSILDTPEAVGRKLDFLVQEMNREANTIGSKAQDVRIAQVVVEIKSEIEKIREQVQNIE